MKRKTKFQYTVDETEDMRFAFEACISHKVENQERTSNVIEIGVLYDLLRALTTSDDSDDITRADVQRLVSKAKAAVAAKRAESDKTKSLIGRGAGAIGNGMSAVTNVVGTSVHAVDKVAHVAHVDVIVRHLPFKGILTKQYNNQAGDDEVNFSEFFMMMTDD